MMRKPVRIALLGAGLIGRRHAAHVLAEPETVLHAIVDPSGAAQAFASECGVPCFADFAAMLAAGRPDGVIVATPNQLHVEHGLAAIAASLPVLVEKPIADNLGDAERLVAAAEAAGTKLATGHHRRHNPLIGHAKAMIEAGKLGRLVAVHGFFWLKKPDDYFDIAWRREKGAGPILVNLIHDIDLMRHLVGEVEAVQAFASNALRSHAVEESAALTLRFANGALGTVNISDAVVSPWSWEHTASENRTFPRTEQTCLFVAGTEGSLSIPQLELWRHAGAGHWLEPFTTERFLAPEEDPLARQIRQFAAVIRGEAEPLVSGREGLETLRVVEAVARAAATGETVKVRP